MNLEDIENSRKEKICDIALDIVAFMEVNRLSYATECEVLRQAKLILDMPLVDISERKKKFSNIKMKSTSQ